MSISSISVAVDRISVATPESPIAVFKVKSRSISDNTLFDVVFAAVTHNRKRIAASTDDLVGIFDGSQPRADVASQLHSAVRPQFIATPSSPPNPRLGVSARD